jgi:murein DD-endopeptidase MepM/ murein hydrolase activator NlpD
VVIDHGNGEFSLVGHLMHESLQVKVGDHVKAGQLLARTGNSGMSSEPHIHFQLMDKADWKTANGFPSEFMNFQLGDRVIERGEPRRADVISPVKLEARR